MQSITPAKNTQFRRLSGFASIGMVPISQPRQLGRTRSVSIDRARRILGGQSRSQQVFRREEP